MVLQDEHQGLEDYTVLFRATILESRSVNLLMVCVVHVLAAPTPTTFSAATASLL